MFSSVRDLPSATSASRVSACLVRLLRRYYVSVRLLARVPARIALLASRASPVAGWPRMPGEVSRFSRVEFLDVLMALGLRRVWGELAIAFPTVWPSRCKHTVGTRVALFEAQFPARRCLCLRFTRHLAAPSARLEVKMVRYSLLVGLFHPRLHAGLSRRLRFLACAALKRGSLSSRSRLGLAFRGRRQIRELLILRLGTDEKGRLLRAGLGERRTSAA